MLRLQSKYQLNMNWVTGYGDAIGLNSNISRPLSGIRDKDGETFQCNIIVEQYGLFICTKIRVAFIPQPCSSAPRLRLPITAILFADDTATSLTKRETELLDVLAKTGFPLNLEFQIFDGRLSGKYEDHVWYNSEKARTSSLVMSREGQQDKNTCWSSLISDVSWG